MSNVVPFRRDEGYEDMPPVMSPRDLADQLGVDLSTLQRMRSAGTGPVFSQPSPRIVRYLRRDVVAWLEAHRQRPSA